MIGWLASQFLTKRFAIVRCWCYSERDKKKGGFSMGVFRKIGNIGLTFVLMCIPLVQGLFSVQQVQAKYEGSLLHTTIGSGVDQFAERTGGGDITKMTIGGVAVFCLDPHMKAYTGDNYNYESHGHLGGHPFVSGKPTASQMREVVNIIANGYNRTMSNRDYYLTQGAVYLAIGHRFVHRNPITVDGVPVTAKDVLDYYENNKSGPRGGSTGSGSTYRSNFVKTSGPAVLAKPGDKITYKDVNGYYGTYGRTARFSPDPSDYGIDVEYSPNTDSVTLTATERLKVGNQRFTLSFNSTSTNPGSSSGKEPLYYVLSGTDNSLGGGRTQPVITYNVIQGEDGKIIEDTYTGSLSVGMQYSEVPYELYKVGRDGSGREVPLSGVEFELFGDGVSLGTKTTDSSGKIKWMLSPNKTYTVKEVSGHRDYSMYYGTTTLVENDSVKVINEKKQGRFILKKEAKDTELSAKRSSYDLSGIAFDIYRGGTFVATIRTDSSGRATSPMLDEGRYEVREQTSSNYKAIKPFTVSVTAGNTEGAIYSVENIVQDRELEIQKVDENENPIPVAGIRFKIEGINGVNYSTEVETDQSGVARVSGLVHGEYKVTELSAPAGYLISSEPKEISLNGTNTTLTYKFSNAPQQGEVSAKKVGPVAVGWEEVDGVMKPTIEDRPLEGAMFKFVGADGTDYGTATTDANGVATMRGISLAGGSKTITITEVEAPNGYQLSGESQKVTVGATDSTTAVFTGEQKSFNNAPIDGKIEINKTFETPKYGTFEQKATFGVYTTSSYDNGHSTLPADSLIAKGEITGDGSVTFDLKGIPYDMPFEVREIETSENYVLKTEPLAGQFDLSDQGQASVSLNAGTIENKLQRGSVELKKIDEGDENVSLAGAEFDLFTKSGTKVNTTPLVTDETGTLRVDELEIGEYYFVETKAPENFFLTEGKFEFSIKPNGETYAPALEQVFVENEKTPVIGTTATFNNDEKHHNPVKDVTIHDDVEYKDLTPGVEYELYGQLMSVETGEPLVIDGKEFTAVKKFTPTSRNGVVRLDFHIPDASSLRGNSVVVYETLFRNQKIRADHKDPNDKGQTVDFTDPKVGTQAHVNGDEKIEDPFEEVTVVDTVAYQNLVPNHEYTMKGHLRLKDGSPEGKPLEIDGKPVTSEVTFTPTSAEGEIELKFTVDARVLRGERIVAFETLLYKGQEIAIHHDINDDGQSIDFTDPKVGTTAAYEDDQKEYNPIEYVTVYDDVAYENLIPGKTYSVKGTLMVKSTEQPFEMNGHPVTVTKEFTPDAPTGTVRLEFVIDSTLVQGEELVAFEEVSRNGQVLAVHADINDEDQTVKVLKPKIGTKALFADDESVSNPLKRLVVKDKVEYKDLRIGDTYTVYGMLMDQEGNPILQPKTEDHAVEVALRNAINEQLSKEDYDAHRNRYATNSEVDPEVDPDEVDPGVDPDEVDPEIDSEVDSDAVEVEADEVDSDAPDSGENVPDDGEIDGENTPGDGENTPDDGEVAPDEPEAKVIGRSVAREKTSIEQAIEAYLNAEVGEDAPIVGMKTFKAEEKDGHVFVEFVLDGTLLRNKETVVFEELHFEGRMIADHKDPNDKDQTVRVTNPEIGTLAAFAEGLKEEDPLAKVTVYDDVKYTDLVPGKEYVITGKLMDKESNSPLLQDGEEVTVTHTFTPSEPNGIERVAFENVQAQHLRSKEIVVFEDLYHEGELIAKHHDITDTGQTVRIVDNKLGTTAFYDDNTKAKNPSDKVVVHDDVKYEDLVVGKEYELKGWLMSKTSGEKIEGTDQSITFIPTEKDGTVRMTFELSTNELRGDSMVAFEELYQSGELVGEHKDIMDEDQTVKVSNPKIGTTAVYGSGKKLDNPLSKVEIHDDVEYEGLIPGQVYEMKGWLVTENGEPIKGTEQVKTFTPEEASGKVRLTFTVDTREYAGQKLVAFEELHQDGRILAEHKDVNDEGQTVHVSKPKIGTEAKFASGEKREHMAKNQVVHDAVKYEGLTPGKKYTIKGWLMNKETEKPVAQAETTFEAESESGMAKVTFEFDGTAFEKDETLDLVAFEELYDGNDLIAEHKDLEDAAQTVTIVRKDLPLNHKKKIQKPKKVVKPKKILKPVGDFLKRNVTLVSGSLLVIGLVGLYVFRFKK